MILFEIDAIIRITNTNLARKITSCWMGELLAAVPFDLGNGKRDGLSKEFLSHHSVNVPNCMATIERKETLNFPVLKEKGHVTTQLAIVKSTIGWYLIVKLEIADNSGRTGIIEAKPLRDST